MAWFLFAKGFDSTKKKYGKEIMAGCKRSYGVRESENKEEWKRKKSVEEEIIQEKMSISCNWRRIPRCLEPDDTISLIDRPTLTAMLIRFVPDT